MWIRHLGFSFIFMFVCMLRRSSHQFSRLYLYYLILFSRVPFEQTRNVIFSCLTILSKINLFMCSPNGLESLANIPCSRLSVLDPRFFKTCWLISIPVPRWHSLFPFNCMVCIRRSEIAVNPSICTKISNY